MSVVEATNINRSFAAQNQSLATNFDSSVIDFKHMPMASIHILWDSITGTNDGEFKIFASNLPVVSSFDLDGTELSGSTITPHNTTGSRIWIRERLAFRYALVRWEANGTTGGTCDIIALGKRT